MIKGFRFTNQLANAEVDARIHQEFLNKNDGIFYGMNLSRTTNSITIDEGLCEIAGRPVAVVDTETVNVGTNTMYCILVLEIDLSKDSTEEVFEQVNFKILESSTGYPITTKEDINVYNTENNIYQLEFARFKTSSSGITDFKDTRNFLSFSGIYNQIKVDCEAVMEQIKQELANVEDGSDYLLKSSGGTVKGKTIFEEGLEGNVEGDCYGNATTATRLKTARNIKIQGDVSGNADFDGSKDIVINVSQSNIGVLTGNTTIASQSTSDISINYPDGFTKDNCIPIACGIKVIDKQGYEFTGEYHDSTSTYWNGYTKYLNLLGGNINLHISNPQTNSVTYYYKIVLMKIS